MSLAVSTDVFCEGTSVDGKPCGNWSHGCIGSNQAARRARDTVALFGWTRREVGGKLVDLCPTCSPLEVVQP